MQREAAVLKAQDQFIERVLSIHQRLTQSAIFLDTFEEVFNRCVEDKWFFKDYPERAERTYLHHRDVNKLTAWLESSRPALDCWEYLRAKHRLTEYPLGILLLPCSSS